MLSKKTCKGEALDNIVNFRNVAQGQYPFNVIIGSDLFAC